MKLKFMFRAYDFWIGAYWSGSHSRTFYICPLPMCVIAIKMRSRIGDDGVRDPEYPCHEFKRGIPDGLCDSDGHYLCNECIYKRVAHEDDCDCHECNDARVVQPLTS